MKKGKVIIIILLIIIIIGLISFVTLLLTGAINLNVKNGNNIANEKVSKENVESNLENMFNITYKEEEYSATNDRNIEIRNLRNIPTVTSSQKPNAAEKITNYLVDISNKEWKIIKKATDDYVDANSFNDLGVTYLYRNSIINKNRLSFILQMNGGFGGVTWSSEEGFNFDANTGEVLTLKNIGEDTYSIVKEECLEYIETAEKTKSQNLYDSDQRRDIDVLLNTVGIWYFEYNQLIVVFPKYSIGPKAIKIKIKKSIINDSLYDKYKF